MNHTEMRQTQRVSEHSCRSKLAVNHTKNNANTKSIRTLPDPPRRTQSTNKRRNDHTEMLQTHGVSEPGRTPKNYTKHKKKPHCLPYSAGLLFSWFLRHVNAHRELHRNAANTESIRTLLDQEIQVQNTGMQQTQRVSEHWSKSKLAMNHSEMTQTQRVSERCRTPTKEHKSRTERTNTPPCPPYSAGLRFCWFARHIKEHKGYSP